MPAAIEEQPILVQKIIEENEQVGTLSFSPPPSKHLETRDSISSIDSDVSLSFDTTSVKENPAENEDEGAHMADLSDSASDTGSRDGGGKDSGCEVTPEVTEPPFTPPSEELSDKIVTQVEFYFSDANITKDAFLLKHVKRNKEGYVSLKLISSFKRVKHLTKDWRVVAHALSRSTKLEINEAGTKLRRKDPLPQYDETTPSRTIVAVHMPLEKVTIENVAELFKACGEIALVRILRPGNPIPADVRQFINKNPSLNGLVCALVEFVLSESARNAIKLQEVYGENMKVYELNGIPHPERKKKNSNKNNKNSINKSYHESSEYTTTSSCPSSSEAEDFRLRLDPRSRIRRGSSANFPSKCTEPAAWLQRRLSASSTEAHFMFIQRRMSHGSRDSSDSSLFLPRKFSTCSISSLEGGSNGFLNRRMSSCSQTSDSSGPRSRSNSTAFHLPENVVRMPQGPDGSRGFRQRAQMISGPIICQAELDQLHKENTTLKLKNRKLTLQLSATLNENTGLFERMMLMQAAKERMNKRLLDLNEEYNITINNLNFSVVQNNPDEIKEHVLKLRDMQTLFTNIDVERQKTKDEIRKHERCSSAVSVTNANIAPESELNEQQESHTKQQMVLNSELQQLTKMLAMKEHLAQQMLTNACHMVDAEAIPKNESKIASLQKERDELLQQLKSAQTQGCNTKVSEQRRKRVQDLEKEIHDLHKKIPEQAKLIKLKEKDELKIRLHNTEIQQMKCNKVKLIKDMKQVSERFRSWKLQREREMLKLKDQDRKRQTQAPESDS